MNTNQQPDREKAIFEQAMDIAASAERDAFLNGACLGNPALRERLDALLRAHEDASQFLGDKCAAAATPTLKVGIAEEPPDEAVGQTLGRYKLLERVGAGGCGVVYVAEQTQPVRRRVALKVIKLGMDTKEVIARFEAERQALAMMDHPNIAKVLDAGTTDVGRPYFVMELVRGIRITDYCDQANLSTKERLDLFIKVCQAIQHAHQKGIIHRDIKPSNILVTLHDGVPVPKVIDFGIAKATEGRLTEATVYTQLHQFIGTPAYMSPEQAEMSGLDIDTRSDIYSLGVLLYELLAGSTPFDGRELLASGLDAMRRTIREKEPMRPSTRFATLKGAELTATARRRSAEAPKLINLLKGDLDWIVMKCLEKDRVRRYETANGLGADLTRHLTNEPVVARPPSTVYRMQKLMRRNKVAFAAGTAIATALVMGLTASVWQGVRAEREAKRAVAALNELRAAAPAFAEQARGLAARERFDEALEKLTYAAKLRPDAPEHLIAKGDLLQCQFHFAEAAPAYRAALALRPDDTRAKTSAALCEELLAAPTGPNGKLTRESLSKLHLAMQKQQRPAAELMPVARLLGEEKALVVALWLARLKDLPVSADQPLEKRLTVRDDGLLALDLSGTKINDLSPLADMPLGTLNLNGCDQITDFAALSECRGLTSLQLAHTKIDDLAPLRNLPLTDLGLGNTDIFDVSVLQGMKLNKLDIQNTEVADLKPLAGMPLKVFDATQIPATDYTPLTGAPLEKCTFQSSTFRDLFFLRDSPVKQLSLTRCYNARGFAVLESLKSLDLIVLPSNFQSLPEEELAAILALRNHPTLKNIWVGRSEESRVATTTQSKEAFWKDWDQEHALFPALLKSGLRFWLTKGSDGAYMLQIENQRTDLSILKGTPITELWLRGCSVTNLTPIQGLHLRVLNLYNNPVADLAPLRGMQIEELILRETAVSDLSPLVGMPLKKLILDGCINVTNVSSLAEIPTLENVTVPIKARNIAILQKLPKLEGLAFATKGISYAPTTTSEEFWKLWPGLSWSAALNDAGMTYSAIKDSIGMWAVTVSTTNFNDCSIFKGAPIHKLNFWGAKVTNLHPLEGLALSQLGIGRTPVTDLAVLRDPALSINMRSLSLYDTPITDFSPVSACTNLEIFNASKSAFSDLSVLRGNKLRSVLLTDTKVTNVSHLRGMPITFLHLAGTKVADLSALRGMPLQSLRLHDCSEITDLSPLADASSLQRLTLPPNAKNFEFLRSLRRIEKISFEESPTTSLPDKTAAEFWKEYDAAKKAELKQP